MKQYELAVGLQQEGNKQGAFKTLHKAIELDPYNARAHLLLGKLFLLNRDDNPKLFDQKAEEHLRKVLEIQAGEHASEEGASAVPEAHNDLGVLYINKREYKKSIPEFEAAIGDIFNREAYRAQGNLGWAYFEMREYPKAVEELSRAVKLRRDFCVGHWNLGRAYAAQELYEKAEQAFTAALEVDKRCDSFQHAWYGRGLSRMNLGHREDARADLERCVELNADSEEGQSCKRSLDSLY